MTINSKDSVLVKDLSGISSPTFLNKKSDDILSIYKVENHFHLGMNSSPEEIVETFSFNLKSNPDGWLIFTSNKYKEKIKKLIKKEFLNAFKNDGLNFDNGERSETMLYHSISNGVIIELVDPECGSEFFYELTDKMKEFMEDNEVENKDLLMFELSHMPDNVFTLIDEEGGEEFLKILDENKIDYYKE